MRLVIKTLIYNLPAIIIVVTLGGVIFYQSIESVLERNVDEVLKVRKDYIIDLLDKYSGESPFIEHAFANIYEIQEEDSLLLPLREVFTDTVIYNDKLNEAIMYRQLKFQHTTNGKSYMISVRKAEVDNDLVLKSVVTTIIITCLVMAVVTIILNVYIFRRIWMPFYRILRNLTEFNLDRSTAYVSAPSGVKEFTVLDNTLQQITNRLQEEYNELKDFTSYLTHELQTPLAVVNGQIDVLIQDKNLTEEQLRSIVTIRNTIQGISEFEQTLIFLKRIELGQFNQDEHIDFSEILSAKVDQTEELIRLKKITMQTEIEKGVWLDIHPQLVDTLLNNIFSNCIRHNIKGGYIQIMLNRHELKVVNSTTKKAAPKPNIGSDFISVKGLGVGLSIIKSICNKHKFGYHVTKEAHEYCLRIVFNPEE